MFDLFWKIAGQKVSYPFRDQGLEGIFDGFFPLLGQVGGQLLWRLLVETFHRYLNVISPQSWKALC